MPKRRNQSRPNRKSKSPAAPFIGRVRDLASDGRAFIADEQGRIYLVSGAWLGERVEVEPTGAKGTMGFGRATAIIEASPARRQPSCVHHGDTPKHCGGCPWMFIDYAEQVSVKQQRIVAQIIKMGAPECVLKPAIASPSEWSYRNRAQFKTDGRQLGYLAARSHALIDVEHCPVLNEANQKQLAELRAQLPKDNWAAGRSALWRTLDIDDQLSSPSLDARLAFRQGNSEQNRTMLQWLAEKIAHLDPARSVLELFCGSGNFTSVLAGRFATVHGVEADESAVSALQALKLPGVTAEICDLFDDAAVDSLMKRQSATQVLVLDPPREGLKIRAPLRHLRAVEVVIYISCDVATWARDCKDLIEHGFALAEVQPLDLFPQTPHIEILSVLRRY